MTLRSIRRALYLEVEGYFMLFKYVGGSKGTEALQTMKYFCEQHTLLAGDPTKFNDPFEFKIAVDFNAGDETIRKQCLLNHPSPHNS